MTLCALSWMSVVVDGAGCGGCSRGLIDLVVKARSHIRCAGLRYAVLRCAVLR